MRDEASAAEVKAVFRLRPSAFILLSLAEACGNRTHPRLLSQARLRF